MKNKSSNNVMNKRFFPALCGLILSGIVINNIGVLLAGRFGLPVYLDSIGTILTAAVGGYLPGILVGFLSNLLSSIPGDSINAYYSLVSVLIAVASAYFSQKDFYRLSFRLLIPIAILAVLGGGGGSILTWFLYGGGIGEGISSGLAHRIYDSFLFNEFSAQLLADLIYDLGDKAVSVLLVVLILHFLPKSASAFFNFTRWKDSAASITTLVGDGRKRGLSLRSKVLLILSASVTLIAFVISLISLRQFEEVVLEEQADIAGNFSQLAASYVDPEKVDSYIEQGEAAPGYLEMKSALEKIWNSTDSIAYLYAYQIREDGCHVVFDLDTPELEGGKPGDLVPFDESFAEYIPALLKGEAIDPIVTNDTFGWLLTVYRPVYDSAGNCKCYVAVDISMPELLGRERTFVAKILSLYFGFFIIILFTGIELSRRHIVDPINSLAAAAGALDFENEETRESALDMIDGLDIRTGDEIENLYHAINKNAHDTANYITEIQKKSETISRFQTGMINTMANLVESRDKNTGMHIKNTASYTRIITDQMKKEGIYADQLSDRFVEDVVASAPLHDIGKIVIPDSILNKPGRLTKEEFELMKTHSAEGAKIIEGVIASVGEEESGYLNEAMNLAHYHHEKWNGSGYPSGLSGQEIPLSARIMAVADVFDALVSKRSYKEGMPFEKAMSIIREGMGSHFDPNVAKAFMDASDRVREVAEGGK
ncbi:MAG: HD domain-containing protein [Lachnospiraceae bacterium]|nr:HD domain-containing protein [Lachnospiraceae bacterium]